MPLITYQSSLVPDNPRGPLLPAGGGARRLAMGPRPLPSSSASTRPQHHCPAHPPYRPCDRRLRNSTMTWGEHLAAVRVERTARAGQEEVREGKDGWALGRQREEARRASSGSGEARGGMGVGVDEGREKEKRREGGRFLKRPSTSQPASTTTSSPPPEIPPVVASTTEDDLVPVEAERSTSPLPSPALETPLDPFPAPKHVPVSTHLLEPWSAAVLQAQLDRVQSVLPGDDEDEWGLTPEPPLDGSDAPPPPPAVVEEHQLLSSLMEKCRKWAASLTSSSPTSTSTTHPCIAVGVPDPLTDIDININLPDHKRWTNPVLAFMNLGYPAYPGTLGFKEEEELERWFEERKKGGLPKLERRR